MVNDFLRATPNSHYLDFSRYHFKNIALEGTGVLIFDTINHKVYVNISPRADEKLLGRYMDVYNHF